MQIFKVFRASEWTTLQQDGRTNGAPVDLADGYIHFSTAEQLPVTLSKHFAGENGLMLLVCYSEMLSPDLRWEPSRGGALFPHLYRALTVTDIAWSRAIKLTAIGHETGVSG